MVEGQDNPRSSEEQLEDEQRDAYSAKTRELMGIEPDVDVEAAKEADKKILKNPSKNAQIGINQAKEDFKLPPRLAKKG